MNERGAFPTGFRRRLAIVFVLVAGLSAGSLAVGAYITVDSYRSRTFGTRARAEVREDVRLLAAGAPAAAIAAQIANTEQPGGPGTLVVSRGQVSSSLETLDGSDVPRQLRSKAVAAPGEIVEARARVNGVPMLVLGTVDEESGTELFAFFPRTELERSLDELRATLAIGWIVVVLLAAVAGSVVARRALRPVASAAAAARSVAEGLLDTRLPVEGADEFGEWATSFNEMVAALEEKISALGEARDRERRFSADIAHELRTPLATILTAVTHVAGRTSELPASEVDAATTLVAEAARRLDRLTAELLELHRLEAGHDAIDLEEVDLVELARQVVTAHGWTRSVAVISDGGASIISDSRRLERIIVNLVANAIQHGGPPVRVRVSTASGAATVDVIDRGLGVSPLQVARIFDRHYKGDRQRTRTSGNGRHGTGLGLSIASEAARSLGGKLEVVTGEQSVGGHFRLELPPLRGMEAEVGNDHVTAHRTADVRG